MTANEIRQKYLDFFKSKGHTVISSSSLIPENDPTTLFVGSGMQPMMPYLLGAEHPEGVRITDSQKCFRQIDIESIGDNRHNTFFEMLGNWSLGDYFKKEQIGWIFEFLTNELKINPEKIYVSVYRGNKDIGIDKDIESVEIWKKQFASAGIEAKDVNFAEKKGMQGGRIFYYNEKENWWSRAGMPDNMPVGEPGGPDSEMFYDLGEDLKRHEKSEWKNQECHPACDCGRFIEIGNSVFMKYIKTEKGFKPLPQTNVDFGGGLERITMIVQGKDNVFETDLFLPAIEKIEKLSGKKYRENMVPFEVIADHIKAATFIMGDDKGIAPSNVDQGYIVRRLIRRAVRHGKQLGISEQSWTRGIAEVVIDIYKETYPELVRNREFVIKNLEEEEDKFSKTIEKGLKMFDRVIKNKEYVEEYNNGELFTKYLRNDAVFNLYQTYGFPLEMTKELANEHGFEIDEIGFSKELKKHQDLSRTASAGKFKGGLADASEETTRLHTTAHLLLAALREVLGEHVFQKGSNITAERLRFDFSHLEKLTDDHKKEVETLVNEVIEKNLPVIVEEMALEEAKEQNAMGVFESKYGEKVKVFTIGKGENMFSKEICGGPHVENTGELGRFKIKKEQSSSSGVRRIKAVLE